jgi:hypothetical protein
MKLNFPHSTLTKSPFSFSFSTLRGAFPIIVVLFLGLYGCSRKIATDKLPATQIVFGQGGGFTGAIQEYALLQDGRIVEIRKDSATQHIVEKMSKKKTAGFYAQVDSMRLHTWLYNRPGNIYHYVILKREGKKDNKIVWDGSGNDVHAPKNIEEYYKRLMAELPKKN